MSTSTQITAEQLLAKRNDGHRYELVQGELRMTSPSGNEHGAVTARLTWRLAKYVEEKALGWLAAGSRIVWVVDPKQRHVTVYRNKDDICVLNLDSDMDAGDLLPEWKVRVSELFPA